MTPLAISQDLPAHTRTWLAYLDSAIAERVGPEMSDRIDEAYHQKAMLSRSNKPAPPNLVYFLCLYAVMLNDQQLQAAKASVARVFPPIPARAA